MALVSDAELRRQLQSLGMDVGPITDTTRSLYQRQLRKRKGDLKLGSSAKKPRLENSPGLRPIPLPWRSSSSSSQLAAKKPARPSYRVNACPPIPRDDSPSKVEPATPPPPPGHDQQQMDLSPPLPPSPSTPPHLSPSSPAPQQSPGEGFVSIVTNWLKVGVKKLIASPRQPLRSPSSPRDARKEPESSPTPRDLEQAKSSPGASGVVLPVQDKGKSVSPEAFDWELMPQDVEICKQPDGSLWRLGKGGFGEVFKGMKDGVDEVAVKVIRISAPSAINQFKQEIDMISKLRHRHILQFYGACVKPTSLYMVTELMQTDLFSALKVDKRYCWEGEFGRGVLVGVASGLHYLHSRRPPVVHRDIKSPNILLMDGIAKIADVGIARTKAASDMTAQRGYTMAWAAPEVVYRKRATEKIDIWSLGVILWEVVCGKPPHPGLLTLPSHAPTPLQQLFQRCTAEYPSRRPNAAECVQELKALR